MAEHKAAIIVDAPVHQVYELFTHFNDFPKFMSFVKEVTYIDDQRSHWVADIVGRHEWDAVNENWAPDQEVGWRSTDGLENSGRISFKPAEQNQTHVAVSISYNPPAGFLGDIGETLGAGRRFEKALQHDLDNFARMVAQAPSGALDPMSSNYLFHSESAAAKGEATEAQTQTMGEGSGQAAAEGNAGWQGGATPASAAGYNAGTSAVRTDSAPTTGTATTWNDDTMAGAPGEAGTTTGSAATVANLNEPITREDQEAATQVEGTTIRSIDDNTP